MNFTACQAFLRAHELRRTADREKLRHLLTDCRPRQSLFFMCVHFFYIAQCPRGFERDRTGFGGFGGESDEDGSCACLLCAPGRSGALSGFLVHDGRATELY